VYEDEATRSIIFTVDKTLLLPEDAGAHEIGISLMDDSEAQTDYTFTIEFTYVDMAPEEPGGDAAGSGSPVITAQEAEEIADMMEEANREAEEQLAEEGEPPLPVGLGIGEISAKGVVTISFNQPLVVPEKVLEL